MPYIPGFGRDFYEPHCPEATTPGELNFQITCLIKKYLGDNLSYSLINDVVGALEGAKLEFYRRVVAPYEDDKILENGDIY